MKRRIMLVVTVWLATAAMMLVLAIPVLADNTKGPGKPPSDFWVSGHTTPGNASAVIHSPQGACVEHQATTTGKTTGGGCETTE
jgi:hypothetical protein